MLRFFAPTPHAHDMTRDSLIIYSKLISHPIFARSSIAHQDRVSGNGGCEISRLTLFTPSINQSIDRSIDQFIEDRAETTVDIVTKTQSNLK